MSDIGGGTVVKRRDGPATRKQAQRVALELFSTQGYETTTMRQIGEVLGINKASLYYHFDSKEAVLRSLFEERGSEAEDIVSWLAAQPRAPDLLEHAVLRWVDSFSADKLRGIRLLRANPLIARVLDASDSERVTRPLNRFAESLVARLPDPTPERVLLLRMSVLSINAAVEAATGTTVSDEAITRAAHQAASGLLHQLKASDSTHRAQTSATSAGGDELPGQRG